MKEVKAMLSFNHPNVMSLIGLCLDTGVPLIIMPFMANGSVLEYLKSNRGDLHFKSNKGLWANDGEENETKVIDISAYLYRNIHHYHEVLLVKLYR